MFCGFTLSNCNGRRETSALNRFLRSRLALDVLVEAAEYEKANALRPDEFRAPSLFSMGGATVVERVARGFRNVTES